MNDSSTGRHIVSLEPRRTRMLGPLQVVRRYSTATGSARGVLNVLASRADADTFEAWPGRDLLERETGLSRSTLRRAIRELEALGEILTVKVGTGRESSRYRITVSTGVENPVETPTVPDREGVHPEPPGGSPRTREGVHPEPQSKGDRQGTREGARPRTCSAHAAVDNPPPCIACRDARLAADAAVEHETTTRLDARRCPHGRIDGRKLIGAGESASRLCPACEVDSPGSTG